ncbi:hypothetical protein [Klebsiella pneumoniae]|uniref:hypothetical protein n=1 Tax=Klebsiella pneumoniae TaxID=573 RepID=UPI000E2C1B94|nr:hypothetical protein [Klebsiella pneumoniae]SXB99903.1 Uncharacterised protein [Klebsiella pneumoniae]
MSVIKTITARMISKVLSDDFQLGLLKADAKDRAAFLQVDASEIDIVIERLNAFKDAVLEEQSEKENQAHKLLEELVAQSGMFSSVEEVLQALKTAPAPAATNRGSNTKTYATWEVVLFDQDKDERRTHTITNKVITKTLREDPVYQAIIKKNPELEDVDQFLFAYSPEYATKYAHNAKWGKKTFHVNKQGRLNKEAQQYYDEWLAKNPDGDEAAFKKQVKEAFKKV